MMNDIIEELKQDLVQYEKHIELTKHYLDQAKHIHITYPRQHGKSGMLETLNKILEENEKYYKETLEAIEKWTSGKDIDKCLAEQKKIIEDMGYDVAYICLHGSQNYGLELHTDEYQSDIDMKAVIIPSLEDLVENKKPVSIKIETKWGQCDIKDIREYSKLLKKGNPSYLETLFTDYYIVDDQYKEQFNHLFLKREDFVKACKVRMMKAMYGMMKEKEKALCHPYPTTKHKIEKYGYDGKQLSHIHRLQLMMTWYHAFELDFKECLKIEKSSIHYETNMRYKLNKIFLEQAKYSAESMLKSAKEIVDVVVSREITSKEADANKEVEEYYNCIFYQIVYDKIVNEAKEM